MSRSLNSHKKGTFTTQSWQMPIGVTTLQMLGHIVNLQGVQPNPEKVRAVQEFTHPKDPKSTLPLPRVMFILSKIHTRFR